MALPDEARKAVDRRGQEARRALTRRTMEAAKVKVALDHELPDCAAALELAGVRKTRAGGLFNRKCWVLLCGTLPPIRVWNSTGKWTFAEPLLGYDRFQYAPSEVQLRNQLHGQVRRAVDLGYIELPARPE